MSISLYDKDGRDYPLVSMISVFYNREYCVKKSVQSMLDQTYPNIEIILVDDKSTDNTLKELKHFENDQRVRVITHANKGFTIALKNAIEDLSNGEFIAIHGSGDISYPDRILNQVDLCTNNKRVGFVSCWYENLNEDEELKEIIKPKSILSNNRMTNHNYSHGEIMYRREAYNSVNGYRSFLKIGQGTDIWKRLNNAGWDSEVVNKVSYKRYMRKGGVSKDRRALSRRALLDAVLMVRNTKEENVDTLDKVFDVEPLTGGLLFRMNSKVALVSFKESIKLLADKDYEYAKLFFSLSVKCDWKYSMLWPLFLSSTVGKIIIYLQKKL